MSTISSTHYPSTVTNTSSTRADDELETRATQTKTASPSLANDTFRANSSAAQAAALAVQQAPHPLSADAAQARTESARPVSAKGSSGAAKVRTWAHELSEHPSVSAALQSVEKVVTAKTRSELVGRNVTSTAAGVCNFSGDNLFMRLVTSG
jgi:hypothetical protein